jgi:hypothetical protein
LTFLGHNPPIVFLHCCVVGSELKETKRFLMSGIAGFDYPMIDLRPDLPTANAPPQAVAARRHSGSQDALAGDIGASSGPVHIPAHDDDERVAIPIRHGKK